MVVLLLFIIQIITTLYVITVESQCNESNSLPSMKHINWETIGQNASNIPEMNITLTVSQQHLTLSIMAQLEYLGYSIADGTHGYGTTYILDFKSENAHSLSISDAGVCSNRLSESYTNVSFNEWWTYSECPSASDQVGQTHEFLSYPAPSKYWNISMRDNNMITYNGRFELNELLSCGSIELIDNEEWINISATFYVNLLSPLSKVFDVGYYYIYQLYSAPFVIAIKRTLHVLSSTGISLFTMTFVAVYKEHNEPDIKYKIIVLTESADYLSLNPNALLLWPNAQDIELQLISDETTGNGECVAIKNSICSQMFELINDDIECANDLLSGQYMIRFNVECNSNAQGSDAEICTNWLNYHDDYIDLENKLNWNDNICSPQVYLIEFQGLITFYVDETFSDSSLQTEDGLYEVGLDRVYVAVSLMDHQEADDEIYDIIDVELTNVWLCTVDETEELSLNDDTGIGGCFSSILIDDNQPYHILENSDIAVGYDDINIMLYDTDTHDVRFSFIVPSDIVRTKLYVHVQMSIDLVETESETVRRLVIDVSEMEFNQFKHYIDSIKLEKEMIEHELKEREKEIQRWSYWWLMIVFIILIVAVIATMFAIYVIVTTYTLKGSMWHRYATLKYATSNNDDDTTDFQHENEHLMWRQIIDDQQEKASSV